jgi:hypothetical protein
MIIIIYDNGTSAPVIVPDEIDISRLWEYVENKPQNSQ